MANVTRYTYTDRDDTYIVTFTRHRDLAVNKLINELQGLKKVAAKLIRFDGAYLRFTGELRIEYRRSDAVVDSYRLRHLGAHVPRQDQGIARPTKQRTECGRHHRGESCPERRERDAQRQPLHGRGQRYPSTPDLYQGIHFRAAEDQGARSARTSEAGSTITSSRRSGTRTTRRRTGRRMTTEPRRPGCPERGLR